MKALFKHLLHGCLFTSALVLSLNVIAADFPTRPITLIVPYGAGGGTDAVARILASQMEKVLSQPVTVVNRTGGNGVVGLNAVATAAPDGYTIGLITVESTMANGMGLTKILVSDLTPLALVNADPASVLVAADSPYKTLKDLLDASTKKDSKLKGSGAAVGGIWHLGLAGMLKSGGYDPLSIGWIPSNGAAPALQDLVAGGVQVVIASLPEARPLIDAGKVRALALMADKRAALFPNVPTLMEAGKSDWEVNNWRGMVGPAGIDRQVKDRLYSAIKIAYDSKEYSDFLTKRGFGAAFADSNEFHKLILKSESEMAKISKSIGLIK